MIEQFVPIVVDNIQSIASNPAVVIVSLYQTYSTTFHGVSDIIIGIKERFNERKFEIFFEALKQGNLSEGTLVKYKQQANKSNESLNSIAEQIIIRIDRLDYEYKAEWCAKLCIALFEGKIDYEIFCDMLSIVERWMESDNGQLSVFYADLKNPPTFKAVKVKGCDRPIMETHFVAKPIHFDRCWRLVGIGVLSPRMNENSPLWAFDFNLTGYGLILSELISFPNVEQEMKSHAPKNPYDYNK